MISRKNTMPAPVDGLILLVVLLVSLKVSDVIDWSWWWLLAPMWGPIALISSLDWLQFLFERAKYVILKLIKEGE